MGWRELRLALEKAVQVLGRLETAPIGAFGGTGKKPVVLTKDTAVPALQWLFYEPACGMMLLVR